MKLLLAILASCTLLQCQTIPQASNSCPEGGTCHFEIIPKSSLEIEDNRGYLSLRTDSGDKLVFCYSFEKDDVPNIADDEYKEELYFEIDSDIDSFSFEGQDLAKVNLTFGRLCFCMDGGYHKVQNGSISGKKINSKQWQISCDLNIETSRDGKAVGNYPRAFSATFTVK